MENLQFIAGGFTGSRRLDEILRAYLARRYAGDPERVAMVSRTRVRRLVESGAVRAGGSACPSMGMPCRPGVRVEICFDEDLFFHLPPSKDVVFQMDASRVIHEDSWMLVVDKPAGIPVEATALASRSHLRKVVEEWLEARDGRVPEVLDLPHRLDRDTSGVLVFSRSREASRELYRIFRDHLARKTYRALCSLPDGHSSDMPELTARLAGGEPVVREDRLVRLTPRSRECRMGPGPEGDPAGTELRIVAAGGGRVLVEARPRTGRTHQIRVHCSCLGMPLLGDALYGGSADVQGAPVPRIMLHAASLELPHPGTGLPVRLASSLPDDFRAFLPPGAEIKRE